MFLMNLCPFLYKILARGVGYMKLGVISDTHRNIEYIDKVTDWLMHRQHIITLYHLGDDYEDVNALADQGVEVAQVPGIYDPKYRDGSLPATLSDNVLGLRILLIHSIEKDLTPELRSVSDIILHGHTHHPEIKIGDGMLIMNPGHLKGPKDKNIEPSFGLLDIQSREVTATIFNLSFKQIESLHLMRTETGLYKT